MKESNYIILVVILITLMFILFFNKNRSIKGNVIYGEYSHDNEYINIDPLKHDIFKQITLDIMPIILISILNTNEFFGNNKILNITTNAILGYSLFYLIIQPYVLNIFPRI